MTIEQLKQRHNEASWHLKLLELEKHTAISINFAIECLKEVVKEYKVDNLQALTGSKTKFKTVDGIVFSKIKELNATVL